MPYTTSPLDSARLFYRDYRPASSPAPFRPEAESAPQLTLAFIHGWPMSSAMWEHLMLPLCESHRVRCVAVDRRGFGKSDWSGAPHSVAASINYGTFAKDTIHVLEELDLEEIVFVAASMGCGETLLAYLSSEWVRERCRGFIWMGASLPFPLRTPTNPQAPSRELWDSILLGLRTNRPLFVKASIPGIFGAQDGGPGVVLEPALLEQYKHIISQADGLAMERCVQITTENDFTEELRKLAQEAGEKVKVLIIHGDCDQGMPYEASGKILANILGHNADVRLYDKAAHGLYLTHQERVLKDILGFVSTIHN